jgi:transposase-like protein
MMTEKPVNYTPEQTAQLVANYKAGASVEALAQMFGKTTRSVVAKLSREGVYQAKTKNTAARVKKSELVDRIAQLCSATPEAFDSLEKANHEVLEAILTNLQ